MLVYCTFYILILTKGNGGWDRLPIGINDDPAFKVKLELISFLNPFKNFTYTVNILRNILY